MQQTTGYTLMFAIFALAEFVSAAEPVITQPIAHRGLLLHAPENTLANFRACLELRLGFEFDVEKTKVGHPPQLKMSADEHQCCLIEIPRNPD